MASKEQPVVTVFPACGVWQWIAVLGRRRSGGRAPDAEQARRQADTWVKVERARRLAAAVLATAG